MLHLHTLLSGVAMSYLHKYLCLSLIIACSAYRFPERPRPKYLLVELEGNALMPPPFPHTGAKPRPGPRPVIPGGIFRSL